jgi:hypothetical protein
MGCINRLICQPLADRAAKSAIFACFAMSMNISAAVFVKCLLTLCAIFVW